MEKTSKEFEENLKKIMEKELSEASKIPGIPAKFRDAEEAEGFLTSIENMLKSKALADYAKITDRNFDVKMVKALQDATKAISKLMDEYYKAE